MERRIALASRAFGALRKAFFLDRNLRLDTKRRIYQACVLYVLLYGSECWIPLRKHVRKLNSFHHRCIRTILGITNKQQWTQYITMSEIRSRWGDANTAAEMVTKRRLGHQVCMPDHRIPKSALFGWLIQPRPRCGPRRRWRDVIKKDLVNESVWYEEACRSRPGWRAMYRLGLEKSVELRATAQDSEQAAREVVCEEYLRIFRRESDRKRYKCRNERQKPVWEQHGAAKCPVCNRWFHSKGLNVEVHVAQSAALLPLADAKCSIHITWR